MLSLCVLFILAVLLYGMPSDLRFTSATKTLNLSGAWQHARLAWHDKQAKNSTITANYASCQTCLCTEQDRKRAETRYRHAHLYPVSQMDSATENSLRNAVSSTNHLGSGIKTTRTSFGMPLVDCRRKRHTNPSKTSQRLISTTRQSETISDGNRLCNAML